MKLYAILQALLGILVADAPVKTIEHVDANHMILVTDTHRVTVTVEKLPQAIPLNGFGDVTNLIYGGAIIRQTNGMRGISPEALQAK